jgi:hypothetical protein
MERQINEPPGIGRCCCNCRNQLLVVKHPWNSGAAKGPISEPFGAACAADDWISEGGRRVAIFFEDGHGKCEMHEFNPNIATDCPRQ